MDPASYVRHDAVELSRLLRSGATTPRELTRIALERLERLNPRLNAVIHHLDAEPFLNAVEREPGFWGGLPFLLKDELELEGAPVTLGSRLLAGHVGETTHPIIKKMMQSGLVFLGRTNMSELGLLPTTEPAAYGPTRNPWNPSHSPGGSSGGAAAAVAAGIVPVAHAVDGGGSIRIPASACGLVGLKVSRGRHRTAPIDPPQGFVTHGCVSRTVRDTAAFVDSIRGSGGGRWYLPDPERPYQELIETPPLPLRIGFCGAGVFGEAPAPDVLASLETTAERLEGLGHHVEEVPPPIPGRTLIDAFRTLWAAGAGVFFRIVQRTLVERGPDWVRPWIGKSDVFRWATGLPIRGRAPVESFTRRLAASEREHRPSDLWLAELGFQELVAHMETYFEDFDIWLAPTMMQLPLGLGALDLRGTDEDVENRLLGYVGHSPLANATGLPALSFPAGFGRGDLPVGMQIFGPLGREDLLLRVAAQVEEAHPWPLTAPMATADLL